MSEREFKGFIPPNKPVDFTQDERKKFSAIPERDGHKSFGPLRSFVKDAMSDHDASLNEVAKAVRLNGTEDSTRIYEVEGRYDDRLTVVTDLHGMNESKIAMLEEVAKRPGEAVILLGDVLGSPKLEELQKLFYNSLTNRAKAYLKEHPRATDQELLATTVKNEKDEEFSMADGFRKVRGYELSLEGKNVEQVQALLGQLAPQDIAADVRRYATYAHYGHYASNLSTEAKQALIADVESNAQALVQSLKKIQAKKVPVMVMQGNWEGALPVDFVPGIDKPVRTPRDQRMFDLQKFFSNNGITFLESLGALETQTMCSVMVPFDISVELGQKVTSPQRAEELEVQVSQLANRVEEARKKGKKIVLISHAVPLFDIHKGSFPDQNQENIDATKGIDKVIVSTQPDNLIYGHLHNKLKNSAGEDMNDNTFNIILAEAGKLILDDGKTRVPGKRIISTYGIASKGFRLGIPKDPKERDKVSPQFTQQV